MEVDGEDQDEHDAEPEHGDGESDRAQQAEHVVEPGVAADGLDDAHRDPEQARESEGRPRERERVRKTLADQGRHRLIGGQRSAEVAVQGVTQPPGVALGHRAVEPHRRG